MMQQVKSYIERFLKQCYKQGIYQYIMSLDLKVQTIDDTMHYIQQKKSQVQLMIDRRMLELENKYITLADTHQFDHVTNIYDETLASLKEELNKIESEYARLERYYSQLDADKAYTKYERRLLRTLVNAY
ncbi:hypothetical protein C7J88_04115 [Staphylococcus muscae]|uniref:Putative staphylococcal protein n=1 Tax=Staphylococcus muscae TaxID=1294 RepID=A0A240C5G1_9STAP|nr:hypothetical protein [Staphylococcus muscae]AVQ33394.1 hypothetical protein C7J88_04115 [Staphylococcus muscae]PNZ03262.1 hypothetical protein CD131_06615 [Staphylococcus muscae]GGA89815.1 hypothetical protein GCM10007183_12560 [Staphylococcus muscae]SNW03165.1 putative staphylococcal protein [Staphylococcus muscae]